MYNQTSIPTFPTIRAKKKKRKIINKAAKKHEERRERTIRARPLKNRRPRSLQDERAREPEELMRKKTKWEWEGESNFSAAVYFSRRRSCCW